jgi:hypothetical protein
LKLANRENKLYVGSDLGAFITGVALHTGGVGYWNFPGTKILSSVDGKNFSAVDCAPIDGKVGPCNSKTGLGNTYGIFPSFPPGEGSLVQGAVNTSIRAMASFKGKLYIGTFNALGGELWSYDDSPTATAPWFLVKKFPPFARPAVTELRVYKDNLYIGLGGSQSGSDYLWSYDGTNVSVVAGQPPLDNNDSSFGVLKLFVSSKNNKLYIGHVDLSNGFTLQSYDGNSEPDEGEGETNSHFKIITDDGFGNPNNAYAWSMKEVNGRIFVGTFNQDFFGAVPLGSSELWYTDDSFNTKYKMDLPSDWGPWNYGIRTMEVGNNMLFLGSASNMVAPDLFAPLNPGAEVWNIRTSVVAPTTGKGGK